MVWVLTSYIVATAVMTPLVAWLAVRLGPQARVPRIGDYIYGRIGSVRHGRVARADRRVPDAARYRRRGIAAAFAGDSAGHQPEGAAWTRHGHLGHGRSARTDPRNPARRLADGRLQLAVGVLREPAGRHSRVRRHRRDAAGDESEEDAVRHVRLHRAERRHRRPAAHARSLASSRTGSPRARFRSKRWSPHSVCICSSRTC